MLFARDVGVGGSLPDSWSGEVGKLIDWGFDGPIAMFTAGGRDGVGA
jgi:hypothetical protein